MSCGSLVLVVQNNQNTFGGFDPRKPYLGTPVYTSIKKNSQILVISNEQIHFIFHNYVLFVPASALNKHKC